MLLVKEGLAVDDDQDCRVKVTGEDLADGLLLTLIFYREKKQICIYILYKLYSQDRRKKLRF